MPTFANYHQWTVQALSIRTIYSSWGFFLPVCSNLSKITNNGPSEKRTSYLSTPDRSPTGFTIAFRTSKKRTPLNSVQRTLINPRLTLANTKWMPQCTSRRAPQSIISYPGYEGESEKGRLRCRCQVNIGIPKNTHPGCLYSRKYRHPDAYIHVNTGTRVPIFTVNMGIPLWK